VTVTVAVRFPLGRYHATAWDRSVNEGAVEWPPSPWRLLRALVATWYTRWPELPAPVLDGLLEALGDPPSYRTPPTRAAHTRHYMPDPDHRKGENGATDLTLDPYLSLPPDEPLLVRWEAQLSDEQRTTLAKLLELMPYIGRADSVCTALLHDTDPEPDETWWRPAPPTDRADETARLLAPELPIRRPTLELTTTEVRKARRSLPPETKWVNYTRNSAPTKRTPPTRRTQTGITAIRFAVVSPAPFPATHGVLLADEVHRVVAKKLTDDRPEMLGLNGAATNHRHAHWMPLSTNDRSVDSFVVWVPAGLSAQDVARIVTVRRVSGKRGEYELPGFPAKVELMLQAVGPVAQVAPELCGPARRWRSLTPYLPVRHRKRESLDDFIASDVRRELGYRQVEPDVTVARLHPDEAIPDGWSQAFRRYRVNERLAQRRPGLGLSLEFAQEVDGPLILGHLSHFGFGILVPDREP
jgi:CRISPR-associated protein Csb2